MLTRGFTLVEVLIVVVIVAVLATIAFPSYQNHVARVRASEAQASLLNLMQIQRRYFSDNNQYTTDLVNEFRLRSNDEGEAVTENGYYILSAAQCEGEALAACIQLTATPTAEVGGTTFGYNSRNEKQPPSEW